MPISATKSATSGLLRCKTIVEGDTLVVSASDITRILFLVFQVAKQSHQRGEMVVRSIKPGEAETGATSTLHVSST
jgi:hypothetical protein